LNKKQKENHSFFFLFVCYLLDARRLANEQQVKETVDVLLERDEGAVLSIGIEQDGTLGTSLGNVLLKTRLLLKKKKKKKKGEPAGSYLVLALLGVGEVVVLVKEVAAVDREGLAVGRADDTDATAGNVLEAQVEATELATDDKEHAKEALGVLDRGQEGGVHAERQGDLGGLVKVGLEHVLVERHERLEDLVLVVVVDRVLDAVEDLFVREGLLDL